jgi:Carboxypeptidase regulatory-like domain/TonB dependent receptor/TonB-dependent Receptor Plug Domain
MISISVRTIRRVVMVLVFSCLLSTIASAQVAGGTLRGVVTDPTGAAVRGAQVTIRNVATAVTAHVTTDRDGAYSLPSLLPGIYEVTVGAPGFRTRIQSGAEVVVGGVRDLNVHLSLGARNEVAEVTTAATTVELTTAELSGVVGARTITELPLNGRDWTQLATLEPGVSSIRTENALGNRVQQGEGQQLTISGGRPWQNNYRLDGISINDYANGAPGSALGVDLGVDAIQEFSVLTSSYPAEYGRSSGGIVNAVTRSGTNLVHGSAYEFLRNSALDARNYFDSAKKPEFRRNQFGGSIGGPLRKDHTFLFGDYEGLRQNLGVTQTSPVPSQAARAGNLSTGPVTVDPIVLAFINAFYPLPTGALNKGGDTGNYIFTAADISSEDFATAKVDHHFSSKDTIDATYLFDKGQASQPDELDNKLFGFSTLRNIATVEEDHTFNSNFLNAARVGFNRDAALEGQTIALNPAAADPAYGTAPGRGAAVVSVPGLVTFTGGSDGFSQHYYHYNSFQEADDAFLTKGINSFKFGGTVERIQDNENAVTGPTGTFKFGSLSSFLTNQPKSYTGVIQTAVSGRGLRQTILGLYVQDGIRVTRNLNIEIGLRYETTTVPSEVQGKLATLLNLTDTAPHLGDPFFANPTHHNFEPRAGIIWAPFGNDKTAVRAGFGEFDVLPLPYLFEIVTQATAPFFEQGSITSGMPAGSFPKGAYSLISSNPSTLRSAYVDPHPPRNYVMHWNVNVQQEFMPGLMGMIAYVGSHGVHQVTPLEDMDTVVPEVTPSGLVFPANGTRLNSNFGRIAGVIWDGNSTYNALEAKLSKTMAHGLQGQVSYTYSKSLDNASTSVGTDSFSNSLTNPQWLHPSLNRGLSDFDVRNNLVLHAMWAIGGRDGSVQNPAGRLPSMLEHGWEVGTILQSASGIPFNAILGGDPAGQQTNSVEDLPNRVAGPGCGNPVNHGNPAAYINLNCLAFPALNHYGNLGRNALIGPGLLSLDASLVKNTHIAERFNLQFRMEAFNIINHTNFAPPLTNNAVFDQTGAAVPGAGQINTTQGTSRQIQFGLKLLY